MGPYINFRDEAGTKNEPDIFLYIQKKGQKIDPHVSNLDLVNYFFTAL